MTKRALLILAMILVVVGFVALIRPQSLLIAHQASLGQDSGVRADTYEDQVIRATARVCGYGALIAGFGLIAFIINASRKP